MKAMRLLASVSFEFQYLKLTAETIEAVLLTPFLFRIGCEFFERHMEATR